MLRRLGVQLVPGDLNDTRSLEAACQGVATVVSTATAVARRLPTDSLRNVDRTGQRALVQAARRTGVNRFVFASVSPNLPRTTAIVDYKREIETVINDLYEFKVRRRRGRPGEAGLGMAPGRKASRFCRAMARPRRYVLHSRVCSRSPGGATGAPRPSIHASSSASDVVRRTVSRASE